MGYLTVDFFFLIAGILVAINKAIAIATNMINDIIPAILYSNKKI
jgi:hypothetical protein